MNILATFICMLTLAVVGMDITDAFVVHRPYIPYSKTTGSLMYSHDFLKILVLSQCCNKKSHLAATDSDIEMTPPEENVYEILQSLHVSQFPFRLVVVGNGAILETTSPLGPVMKLSQSPQTGENLLTFASKDQSFEFHLKIAQVSKIVLTEKEGPQGKTMRIFRFLTDEGKPMCSLILADKSEDSIKWFHDIREKYGSDIQL